LQRGRQLEVPLSPLAQILEAWRQAWRPFDRRPIYEWASTHVNLPSCYAISGFFHVEKSRYLIGPLDAIRDPLVREVTILKGVQTGGSLIGDLAVCDIIENNPGNTLWNFPTEEQAEDWAKRRAIPLLNNCPGIAAKLEKIHRHKKGKKEIHFPSMWLSIQGAHPSNLQSHSVPFVINDELWQFEQGMYLHAKARTTYFHWRSKIINISQAGQKGDDLDQAYEAGSQEVWQFPCPACHFYQAHEWSIRREDGTYAGVIWDTNQTTRPGGQWNYDAVKASAAYKCANCGFLIRDTPRNRRDMNDFGHYFITNPNAARDKKSFQWTSLASDQISFGLLIEEYLRAKEQAKLGNRIPLREFWLKRMAQPYDPEKHDDVELMPTIELTSTAPGAAIVHDGKTFTTLLMAVDVQTDCFWVVVEVWTPAGDDLVLWAGRLITWADVIAKRVEYSVPNGLVTVDCRFRPHDVFVQCTRNGTWETVPGGKRWQCWRAAKGEAGDGYYYKARAGAQKGKAILLPYVWPLPKGDPCHGVAHDDIALADVRGRFCSIVVWYHGWIKSVLADRRDGAGHGVKSYVLKGPWNQTYARQMNSERKEFNPITRKWLWKKFRDNHLWDCRGMNLTRAFMLRIIGDTSAVVEEL
jgi:phage terminase large subunit GpA